MIAIVNDFIVLVEFMLNKNPIDKTNIFNINLIIGCTSVSGFEIL